MDEPSHTEYAINDQFAIGSSCDMDIYTSVFDNIEKMANSGCVVNPECFVGYNLRMNGIQCDKRGFRNPLKRDVK